jgi:hypothetical protein
MLVNTIKLQRDESPEPNKDRLLKMIFGFFFVTVGSLYIVFSHSLYTRMIPILQALNSTFFYEDRVKSM